MRERGRHGACRAVQGRFHGRIRGRANEVSLKAPQVADGICGLELFAVVVATRAPGDQLRGKKMVFSDNIATAGALVDTYATAHVILAMADCFWSVMAQQSKSCWIGRVPSKAYPADAPSCGEGFGLRCVTRYCSRARCSVGQECQPAA